MQSLRWGILGTARIAKKLIPAVQSVPGQTVTAIASRDEHRAQKFAAQWDIGLAFGSYEALLESDSVDCVYIPLPNHLHAQWVERAARKGKHVLCEKPLAPNAREAAALWDLCAEQGVLLMDAFVWPHHPQTQILEQLLGSEDGIGPLRHIDAWFSFALDPDADDIRWSADAAGGSLLDVGCYPVFAAQWIFGALPERVAADVAWHRGVDRRVHGLLHFGQGRTASVHCAFDLRENKSIRIEGRDGRILIPDFFWAPTNGGTLLLERDSGVRRVSVPEGDGLRGLVNAFATMATKPLQGFAQRKAYCVGTLRTLDALRSSWNSGSWVEVDR